MVEINVLQYGSEVNIKRQFVPINRNKSSFLYTHYIFNITSMHACCQMPRTSEYLEMKSNAFHPTEERIAREVKAIILSFTHRTQLTFDSHAIHKPRKVYSQRKMNYLRRLYSYAQHGPYSCMNIG